MKRRVTITLAALLLVGVGYVAWTLAGLPPVKYYLRYGLDPYCEPTGQTMILQGVTFVEIGPGTFRMGSTYNAEGGDWLGKLCKPFGLPWGKQPKASNEMPVHWVELRHGFWIAVTEITNAQFKRCKPKRDRKDFKEGRDIPVCVSWEDANEYCAWLSKKSGRPIRLPSEAEWECACRAGSNGAFAFGDDEERLSEYAWFGEDFDFSSVFEIKEIEIRARAVATKRPNRWGLHDFHGNVLEWCEDTWHDSYEGAPIDGSPWVDEGSPGRVARGGCLVFKAFDCRSAFRCWDDPLDGMRTYGFRPAFVRDQD